MSRRTLCLLIGLCLGAWAQSVRGQSKTAAAGPIAPGTRAALNRVSPDSLRANLSFLSSDALEGRYTPSPGLEVAAEFIASQFRKARLEPGGDQEYFQIATMTARRWPSVAGGLSVSGERGATYFPASSLGVLRAASAFSVNGAPLIKLTASNAAPEASTMTGKAIVLARPDFGALQEADARRAYEAFRKTREAARKAKPAVLVVVSPRLTSPAGVERLVRTGDAETGTEPELEMAGSGVQAWFDTLPEGATRVALSVSVPAPLTRQVALKNVIGILRGSDPKLAATCVMITAHYDHIGTLDTATGTSRQTSPVHGDRIFNGANDDGSGTVSVVEIAGALAQMKPKPKRSLVFMTFFGEELGLYGSEFYSEHPVFPFDQTVADLNLEQVGRTDSNKGRQVNSASLTGYDYSDVTGYVERAGRLLGMRVYKDDEASDAYFLQSDNASLAEHGVPAHSLTVAFEYPDYHGLGDEWRKIDYDNMARVDRMVALAAINLANSPTAPGWNAANSKAKKYRTAREHAGATD